ncbi:MAG: hypothetical protein AABW80_04590 [Nanoarchaeota archaeon]
MNLKKVRECFITAKNSDAKGRKHKGLLVRTPNQSLAEHYILKAKENLEDCDYYLKKGRDYKLPETWFYTLYYCALAILSKFGLESRSQRCTASFMRYIKDSKLIEYDDEFIERITVYDDKNQTTDVDKREEARYGPETKIKDVEKIYLEMTEICRRAITQTEEIVFSNEKFEVPKELLD